MKCAKPLPHEGVLLSNPPQYRCVRKGCLKTWVVGTEPPECTLEECDHLFTLLQSERDWNRDSKYGMKKRVEMCWYCRILKFDGKISEHTPETYGTH